MPLLTTIAVPWWCSYRFRLHRPDLATLERRTRQLSCKAQAATGRVPILEASNPRATGARDPVLGGLLPERETSPASIVCRSRLSFSPPSDHDTRESERDCPSLIKDRAIKLCRRSGR